MTIDRRSFTRAEVHAWFRDPENGPERTLHNRNDMHAQIERHTGIYGPTFNLGTYLDRCVHLRRMFQNTSDALTRADHISKHRRMISTIKNLRYEGHQYRAGISPNRYHVDISTNHVQREDFPKMGIVFTTIHGTVTGRSFTKLRRQIGSRKPQGLWSSLDMREYGLNWAEIEVNVAGPVESTLDFKQSCFWFSNPDDIAIYEEELLHLILSKK